jgi:LacI family transcriptional regulator
VVSHPEIKLSDVARQAGVSMMTVSNVLAERGGFNAETAENVRKAARKLGYRPNTAARAMAQRRFGSFALLLGQAPRTSPLPPALLEGVEDGLAENGEHLVVARLPDAKLTDPDYVPAILRDWMSDGLLVNYHVNVPERMVELIEQTRLPAIWINVKRDHDAVRPDDAGMAAEVTRRLLDLGHRRIAYADLNTPIGEQPEHYSSLDRREGYRRTMESAGLAPAFVGRPAGCEDYSGLVGAVLARRGRPTAVVTYDAFEASCFLHVATLRGLAVPRDLSVATFGAASPQVLDWKLATMLIHEREVGLQAVCMLREKVTAPATPHPTQALQGTFLVGGTVAARRRTATPRNSCRPSRKRTDGTTPTPHNGRKT